MEKTLKEILEGLLNTLDPSKEVVTESIREDMTDKFISAVTEAVQTENQKTIDESIEAINLIDEAAANRMVELNKEYEKKNQKSIDEAVDAIRLLDETFENILEFTVEQFDERAVGKLEECKEAFDNALETEIEDLCESVEAIIETKLEEANCDADLASLSKLEKLETAFENMREIFFKDAILDQKVTESVGNMKGDYDKLLSQNINMAKKLNKIEVDSYLESETADLKPALKAYMIERFENSKIDEVKELWESASEDYKKLDEENRKLAKKTAHELDVNNHLDEDQENDEENELNEADSYYEKAAQGYSQFFKN